MPLIIDIFVNKIYAYRHTPLWTHQSTMATSEEHGFDGKIFIFYIFYIVLEACSSCSWMIVVTEAVLSPVISLYISPFVRSMTCACNIVMKVSSRFIELYVRKLQLLYVKRFIKKKRSDKCQHHEKQNPIPVRDSNLGWGGHNMKFPRLFCQSFPASYL